MADEWTSIRLGYTTSIFPYFFVNDVTKTVRGIYIEMWKLVARQLKLRLEVYRKAAVGGFMVDEEGLFPGILGEVQNGSLDASLEDYAYRAERLSLFYTSTPVDYSTDNFYVRDKSVMLGAINSFLVFPLWMILLLFVSFALVVLVERLSYVSMVHSHSLHRERQSKKFAFPVVLSTISLLFPQLDGRRGRSGRQLWTWLRVLVTRGGLEERLREERRKRSWSSRLWWYVDAVCSTPPPWGSSLITLHPRRPSHFVQVLSVFCVLQVYNAYYAGNATAPNAVSSIDLYQLVTSLRELHSRVMVQDMNALSDVFYNEVYPGGNLTNRVFIESDIDNIAKKLCSDGSLFAYITSFQLVTFNHYNPIQLRCNLITVNAKNGLSRFPSHSNITQLSYGLPHPTSFYIGRRIRGFKLKEAIDDILLKFFDADKMKWLWWRRFTGRERDIKVKKQEITYSPTDFNQTKLLFIILLSLYGLAVAMFIGEMVYWRYHRSEVKGRVLRVLAKTASRVALSTKGTPFTSLPFRRKTPSL